MKLDQQELENLQSEINAIKSKNSSDDIDVIEEFLEIVEKNLSENYKFLGTDCYKKDNVYRFQAFIDGTTKEVKSQMIDFLCMYPELIGKNVSVNYRGGFRIVLTMNLIAD